MLTSALSLVSYSPPDQSHQQEAADALPDGQLRAANQAADETHRDGECGRKGQSRRILSNRGNGHMNVLLYLLVSVFIPLSVSSLFVPPRVISGCVESSAPRQEVQDSHENQLAPKGRCGCATFSQPLCEGGSSCLIPAERRLSPGSGLLIKVLTERARW